MITTWFDNEYPVFLYDQSETGLIILLFSRLVGESISFLLHYWGIIKELCAPKIGSCLYIYVYGDGVHTYAFHLLPAK
jgi:hypothetical protein